MSYLPRLTCNHVAVAAWLHVFVVTLSTADAQQPFFMGLGDLPGGAFYSQPLDISADGSVVVGHSAVSNPSANSNVHQIFRWTRETGMVPIGLVESNRPRISADGSTIVGNTAYDFFSNSPFRWTEATGAVTISFEGIIH